MRKEAALGEWESKLRRGARKCPSAILQRQEAAGNKVVD